MCRGQRSVRQLAAASAQPDAARSLSTIALAACARGCGLPLSCTWRPLMLCFSASSSSCQSTTGFSADFRQRLLEQLAKEG